MRRSDLQDVVRPMRSAEQRKRHAEELIARLKAGHDEILARRGGKLLPSSVDAIREAREARYEQL